VPDDKVRLIVQRVRTSGEGGAFHRRPAVELSRGAPVRAHRDQAESLDSKFKSQPIDGGIDEPIA
jgi:hypothetical protein